MAASSNATLLADLLDPQVVADYVDKKLIDAIRFSPLAVIRDDLVGRPGDEVTLPSYNYAGDSIAVNEGQDIPIAKLTQSTETVKISKIGKAIEFSDEALLSAYNNDIAEEAAKQVVTATNSKLETDLINAMKTTATLTATIASGADPADAIADALVNFGEETDEPGVLVIPPTFYASLRKSKDWIPNTEVGADIIIRGRVGMVHGLQVVTANRVIDKTFTLTTDTAIDSSKTYYTFNGSYVAVANPVAADLGNYYELTASVNNAYIVKPDALAIFMKRDTLVEFDRDILSEMNYIKASKLFAPYVYDKSKVIKLTIQ